MKKILTCIVVTMLAMTTFAQTGAEHQRRQREFNSEENALRRTNQLNEVLQLDSIQYQVVYIMYLSDAMTMQDSLNARRERAERMRQTGERPQRRQMTSEEMQAERELREQRREVRNQQMQEILTEEQFQKYLQYEEEENRRRAEGFQGRRGPGPRNRNSGEDRRQRE